MLLVVARLFEGFGRNSAQFFMAAMGCQVLPQQFEPGGGHGVAQDRKGKVAARQLRQGDIEVIALVAQKRQLVFVKTLPIDLASQREHRTRLANQIESDIGHGNVLFQNRRVPAPFADALGQDETAIANAQQVLRGRRRGEL